jgi:LigXa C-terminal domain like/Rieske [2Fe-2S] domain
LRCIYHGWKFDAEGNCLDMPNLPADQEFRDKVKARAYRAAERNGIVYVYMGERQAAPPTLANTTDWFGRWRSVQNSENDYQIDRNAQRTISFSGIAGVFSQDSAVTESMGAITDRALETLAPSDVMIATTRRQLLDAAQALRETGRVPPLVDDTETALGARSGDLIAPESQPWLEAYQAAIRQRCTPQCRWQPSNPESGGREVRNGRDPAAVIAG